MAGNTVQLSPGTLTLGDLRRLIEQPSTIALDPASFGAIDRSAARLDRTPRKHG